MLSFYFYSFWNSLSKSDHDTFPIVWKNKQAPYGNSNKVIPYSFPSTLTEEENGQNPAPEDIHEIISTTSILDILNLIINVSTVKILDFKREGTEMNFFLRKEKATIN